MSDEKPRSYISRLLNYKRYIDFLVEKELRRIDEQQKLRDNKKPNPDEVRG